MQRKAPHFVKGKYRWNDGSVTEMIKTLGWSSLANRRRELRLALMYKVVFSLVAAPAEHRLVPADNRTRANNNYKYQQISTRTNNYKYSFFPRTILDWNELDIDIVPSTTIASFKERLKSQHSQ